MNEAGKNPPEALQSLLLMTELEQGAPISQRAIADRLGIALGRVNSYLRNLVDKGYVQVKAGPRNRFAYLLTSKGIAEKNRLAGQQLGQFHRLYRLSRQESLSLFRRLRQDGVRRVAFCGLDELTEIAYLSLREAGLELAAVMDEPAAGSLIGMPVVSLDEGCRSAAGGPIILTSLSRARQLKVALSRFGVAEQAILEPSYSLGEILGGDGRPQASSNRARR